MGPVFSLQGVEVGSELNADQFSPRLVYNRIIMYAEVVTRPARSGRLPIRIALAGGAAALFVFLVWQALTSGGAPDPTLSRPGSLAGVLDIGVLVFREGLECVLVLSAITAGMVKTAEAYRRPVAAGVGVGFLATLATWFVAVGIVDDLTQSFKALYIQAATGLLAIFVLLVVMNWFFHKIYWTGWISMHNKRRHTLLQSADEGMSSHRKLLLGMVLLGFSSFYREGVEVVLFLQSYRLKLGGGSVFWGVSVGLLFTAVVAVLTFQAHKKLPYKKMLVLTGIMLGVVLIVMVGEQAQEMQLAHWLPTTTIPALATRVPAWAGLWFSVFPTVETLAAQVIAGVVVVGSYFAARK
jgi:high-affinity iron transporter